MTYVGESVYCVNSKGVIGSIPPLPLKGGKQKAYVLDWVLVKGSSQASILEPRDTHCVPFLIDQAVWRTAGRAKVGRRAGGGLRMTSRRPIGPGTDCSPACGRGGPRRLRKPPRLAPR